jgi:hypothetical protein
MPPSGRQSLKHWAQISGGGIIIIPKYEALVASSGINDRLNQGGRTPGEIDRAVA